jgi:hypothetical protein
MTRVARYTSVGVFTVFVTEPIHMAAYTGPGHLRVSTADGQSHLLPSAWLDIPEGGWLVIECQ